MADADLGHDGLHLHGAYVLPLPPECVSGSVLEVHPAKLVLYQNVTRSEICLCSILTIDGLFSPEIEVPLREHVLHDLLAGAAVVGVAMEVPHRVALVNATNQLPSLAWVTLHS